MQRLQLALELGHGRRVQEAERHRAVLARHRVVHAVGLVQALEVAAARRVRKGPAPMHQAVVGDEVQGAVGGHAGADPLQRRVAFGAEINQGDGHTGKHHGKQVVFLEPAGARLVVRLMPAPAEAMHDVFVRDDGKQFHEHHGQQYDSCIQ